MRGIVRWTSGHESYGADKAYTLDMCKERFAAFRSGDLTGMVECKVMVVDSWARVACKCGGGTTWHDAPSSIAADDSRTTPMDWTWKTRSWLQGMHALPTDGHALPGSDLVATVGERLASGHIDLEVLRLLCEAHRARAEAFGRGHESCRWVQTVDIV